MGYWDDIYQTFRQSQVQAEIDSAEVQKMTTKMPTLYVFAYLDQGQGQPSLEALPMEERVILMEAQQQKLKAELSKLREINAKLKKHLDDQRNGRSDA